jgi:hypothetical protein
MHGLPNLKMFVYVQYSFAQGSEFWYKGADAIHTCPGICTE